MSPPSFSSVRLDLTRERFRDHSDTGEKILNQCFCRLLKAGLAFDAATLGESERKRKMCMRKQSPSPSNPPLLLFSSPLCFLSVFLSCLSSLLSVVIVSFSLSKNIVFLPRSKEGEISTCVRYLFICEAGRGILGEIRCLNDSRVCSMGNAEHWHLQYTH